MRYVLLQIFLQVRKNTCALAIYAQNKSNIWNSKSVSLVGSLTNNHNYCSKRSCNRMKTKYPGTVWRPAPSTKVSPDTKICRMKDTCPPATVSKINVSNQSNIHTWNLANLFTKLAIVVGKQSMRSFVVAVVVVVQSIIHLQCAAKSNQRHQTKGRNQCSVDLYLD